MEASHPQQTSIKIIVSSGDPGNSNGNSNEQEPKQGLPDKQTMM